MIGKIIEMMILAGMENHVYRFGHVIRKQTEGGPIGLALTGELAECYMIAWEKKFIKKLETLGINLLLYERFKDDITLMIEVIANGTKFENEKLIVDGSKLDLDEAKPEAEVTMTEVVNIAESVDGLLKFTFDIPNYHESGKIPVLDVCVNVNKEEGNRIDYEYFEKPTKNKRVILQNAALPSKQKRTILTQECLRRLRNTKIELGKDIQVKHLNNFMLDLKNSGYSAKYRTEILDSALLAFEKMINDDKAGIKPLFRDREWNKEERSKNKKDRKVNWYKTGKIEYKSILFVPVTKGGQLAKEIRKREEELNRYSEERIKIIEGGGVKIKDFLVKKDPFPTMECEMKKCILCSDGKKVKIPCNSNNVGYRLFCDTCQDRGVLKVYEGETARSARVRGVEHMNGFKNMRNDNALYKHKANDHKDEEMSFRMEITKKFSDPLSRQANEAVRISERKKHELLNSKNEFNHPPIARISVERNKRKLKNTPPLPAQPSFLGTYRSSLTKIRFWYRN